MSMFSGRYKQMFFIKNSSQRRLKPNEYEAHHWFPCSHLRQQRLQSVAGHIDVGGCPTFNSREHPENATCHKIAAKKRHDTNDGDGKRRSRWPLKARRKIPFRRVPSKNVMKII